MCCLPLVASAQTGKKSIESFIAAKQQQWVNTYQHLHANPELSGTEANTAAYLKQALQGLGFEIIDSLGFYSFAAVLKNGKGKTILYRTDMDGLPVKEATNLPYASTVQAVKAGETTGVMHACGHDIHMTSWLGVAQLMSQFKSNWKGTLVLLAQSSEETGQGAKRAIAAKAFASLPTPDIQLAFHDQAALPAGQIGFCDGFAMAAVDMMNITIYGKGGHGASPQQTIDPVLLAAQYITNIQSIVSRNLSSNDPAVITVGAIHGGTAGNIIPDQVMLKLTIRSFSQPSRQLILDRLKTIGNHMAAAAGLPADKMPLFDLLDMSIPSVYNDPALGNKLRKIIQSQVDSNAVTTVPPIMIGEDFGVYGQQAKPIPSYLMWLGTVSPALVGTELPSLHSARFAPDATNTLPSAVRIMGNCLLQLFNE